MDFLLKRPKKWTSAHLQAVNPREYDEVAASAIVPEAGLVANQDNCSTDVVPVKTLNTQSNELKQNGGNLQTSSPPSPSPRFRSTYSPTKNIHLIRLSRPSLTRCVATMATFLAVNYAGCSTSFYS